ncbi:MAG: histidinol-phosphatase [Clostridia bacterium]|nr:histidinol-phosphatase [Clostridia bacterium]
MLASYHTHTYRCGHAVGKEEEYIEKAIAEGLKTLGFADHAPMRYRNGFVSGHKMRPEEIGEYFSTLGALKEKYRNDIDIKIGLETEYYPDLWEDCLDFWSAYPVDYILLGQHFSPNEDSRDTYYSGHPFLDESKLSMYVDLVCECMNTGKITYLAHPDLINYAGSDLDFYIFEMRRLIAEAMKLGIPLEYNLLGMKLGRNYPNELFWNEVADMGALTVIGCDSHAPRRVADAEEISFATAYLNKRGIKFIDEIELIKPF